MAPWSHPSAQLDPVEGDAMSPTLTALLCLETLPKPTIWAEPGSVITWGEPVSIWCQGTLEAEHYRLDKVGISGPWDTQNPLEPRDKAQFSILSMTEDYAGRYRCSYRSSTGWSACSEPLELVVTGPYSKPTLSALPSPVVTSGGNVTLQCGSFERFGGFVLSEGEHRSSWTLDAQPHSRGLSQALFYMGPVSPSHRGPFRCYGYYRNSPQVWSEPSEPLELQVSGEIPATPSLSAQPGPNVPLGENVTLRCQSWRQMDIFLLSKEGVADLPLRRRSQHQAHLYLADFTMSPVTPARGGTYRCYGSYSTNPYLLSQPSIYLELLVSGAPDTISPPQHKPDSSSASHDYTVENLIRMGVAGLVLVVLAVLLLQAWHSQRSDQKAATS
ncbi:leukocyte immunoglobulin-like receptor subfamily A member 5 isoform X2 [Dasypus novemcinctus]|uniref:leukocyte immunoglobulin-like receptor subfamily A member 5 isoform X2 n=1 Tax=Dasypus novemcinctus TaxID=9361 RepID=UPI00265F03BC|nr:leukocyte immunoglobulin-like receptor subfamily A member 5 isoform X2 [Dasypus novemcinctus]